MVRWWLAAAGVLMLMLAVRMVSPSDIFDNDQARPCAHIIDVAVNGDWLMQDDPAGLLATKPPMYPWLGAMGVYLAGGRTDEWVLKAPLWISYLLVAFLIVQIARLVIGGRRGTVVGCLAAAMWAANFHVFKLAYTARTDMLVTALITVALWALLRQRSCWAAAKVRRRDILLFWLAVAAAVLTKGPPALLPLGVFVGFAVADRPPGDLRWRWQLGGFVLMLTLVAAWVWPALAAHPQWMDNINREVVERVTGTGSGAARTDPWWFMPMYLVVRPVPWNFMFFAALGVWLVNAARRSPMPWVDARPGRLAEDASRLGRIIGWVVFVLVVFTIPQGRRADYLLPAYPAVVIVAAWLVDMAESNKGWHRVWVHLITGGVALVGMAVGLLWWRLPSPAPLDLLGLGPTSGFVDWDYRPLVVGCAALAGVMGIVALVATHWRRYRVAALAGTLVMVGNLGLYQTTLASPGVQRRGDALHAVVQVARDAAARSSLPVVCHEVGTIGSEAIPALLGQNQPWDERALSGLWAGKGAILVVGEAAWAKVGDVFAERATPLARTAVLPNRGSTVQVRVVRIDPVAASDSHVQPSR